MDVRKGMVQYKGKILVAAEGQGPDKAPGLFIMNPVEPYNVTGMSLSTSERYPIATLKRILLINPIRSALEQLFRAPVQLPQ